MLKKKGRSLKAILKRQASGGLCQTSMVETFAEIDNGGRTSVNAVGRPTINTGKFSHGQQD